jgi:hypothetical protein
VLIAARIGKPVLASFATRIMVGPLLVEDG